MSKIKAINDIVNPFIEERLADLEKLFPQTVSEMRERGYDSYSFDRHEGYCVESFNLKGLPCDTDFYSVAFIHHHDEIVAQYFNSKHGWSEEYDNEENFLGFEE